MPNVPRLSAQVTLTCTNSSDPNSQNADSTGPVSREALELQNAPHPSMRIGKHALAIGWLHGKHIFRDSPPFDEPLDGIAWYYCGYSPQLKMHLIGEDDIDVFTGVLLNDANGSILPAGKIVEFSPDGRRYFAYEQPDGQDGPTLKLYKSDGKLLWKGFDGLTSKNQKWVNADFETVEWTRDDRLLAEYTVSGVRHKLILSLSSDGNWHWKPTASE